MIPHRALIEAGPGTIRRLCCGTVVVADAEVCAAALGGIDDPVALLDELPIAVDSLWRTALRSLMSYGHRGLTVVHPSWWSMSRVDMITAAAQALVKDVVVRPRSWLLTQHSSREATVVEIADRLVAVGGSEVVAVPRGADPDRVVAEVAGVVSEMRRDTRAVVLVDAPSAVVGAAALGKSLARTVRGGGQTVVEVDDARLERLAAGWASQEPAQWHAEVPAPTAGRVRLRAWMLAGLTAVGVISAVSAATAWSRRGAVPAQRVSTTFLVEGRVTLSVPAGWPTQRVVAGPGSARVQVTSPSDPELALHVTQSPVVDETFGAMAERLKRAIDAEPAGIFVDFNPAGSGAGRPAVTYREVRAGHQVLWTVLLDGAVRISVGCQSRPGADEAIRGVCEQAVGSAHAMG